MLHFTFISHGQGYTPIENYGPTWVSSWKSSKADSSQCCKIQQTKL